MILPAKGQVPFYKHFDLQNGLTSNKVYSITQDSKGFIWVSTDNGVLRYDGSGFKHFGVEEGLPDNDVYKVFEDAENRLWLLCFKQSPCFFLNGRLHTSENDSLLNQYFNKRNNYHFDVNYNLKRIFFYYADKNVFHWIEYGNARTIPCNSNINFNFNFVQLFRKNNHDVLFLYEGLFDLTSNEFVNGNVTNSGMETDQINFDGTEYYVRHSMSNKLIAIGDLSKEETINYKFSEYVLGPYYSDGRKVLFISDSGQVFYMSKNFSMLEKSNIKLPPTKYSNVFTDRNGNIWAGTRSDGLYMVPFNGAMLYPGISKNLVYCLSGIDGDLLVGTEEMKLFRVSSENKVERINLPVQNPMALRILGIVVTDEGVYCGGDFELVKYDRKLRKSKTIRDNMLFTFSVKDIEPCKNDNILIGSANGAGILNTKSDKITKRFWYERTVAVFETKQEQYYLGTVNGLFVAQINSDAPVKLVTKTLLDNSRITDIKEGPDNTVWVGSAQHGLFVLDQNTNRVKFHISKELTSNYIKNIYLANENEILVSTDKGINRIGYLKNRYSVTKINKAYGFSDDNISSSYCLGNKIFIGTSTGLASFNSTFPQFTEVPGLEIVEVLVNFNQRLAPGLAQIELGPENNNVSFIFAAIALNSGENISYRYQLKDANGNWIVTKNNRIDLLGLEPGKHTFRVQAINLLTGRTSEIREISIVVQSPWYQSWWFILLIAAFSLMVLGFLIRGFLRKNKIKAETARQLASMEMQALRAQMNPHFIFNSLTAIQNFFMQNRYEEANNYLTKFSRLIRQILESSMVEFISLKQEIELLENYMALEELRFGHSFVTEIIIDADVNPEKYGMPTMIIQPLMENAVNHGLRGLTYKGEIKLLVRLSSTHLLCTVVDNGKGIKNAGLGMAGHKSSGMELIVKRLNSLNILHNADFKLEIENVSKGTSITVFIPISVSLINTNNRKI